MSKPDFHGLSWTSTIWGLDPTWTLSPSPPAIAELLKSLNIPNATISFLAQGGFNKVYIVASPGNEDLILRIALPVDPRFKTRSEVATMEWMRYNTSAVVPRVVRYGESRANIVGFEWILMTRLPGKHLGDVWNAISYAAKEALVRRIAGVWAELFRCRMRGVGNIYSASSKRGEPAKVGRIVSMQFFWGEHIHQDVPRGPFESGREWMLARLGLYERECRATLERCGGVEREGMESGDEGRSGVYRDDKDGRDDEGDEGDEGNENGENGEDGEDDEDDEYDKEDAERTLDIVMRLKPLVDRIFPEGQSGEEKTVFFHHDPSNHNVLVDDDGALTGLLDWECVSAVPLWKACDFPSFLEGRPREVKLDQTAYDLNDEDHAEDYWRYLKEYEITKLRRVFLDEMAILEPEWMEIFKASQVKRDLDSAVLDCASELSARNIRYWSDNVMAERSNMLTLEDRRYGCYGPDDSKDDIIL
jgi:aminoglycoside phosphotransferase (APT) family kinase protein